MIVAAAMAALVLFVTFGPLERAFPAWPEQRVLRPAWSLDVVYFLAGYVFWGGMSVAAVLAICTPMSELLPADFRASTARQPFALQALEVIVLSDFCIYWAHRLQHRVEFLWRFHAVHHSAEQLDWLAAHREHPLDTVYTVTAINLPAFVLGFPLETLATFFAFRGLWAVYIHSNVRLPLRPIRWLIGAPELHHWHHDKVRDAGNYANVSPVMDLIFGTYRCPDHEPRDLGIDEDIGQDYISQILSPFRARGRRRSRPQKASTVRPGR